MAVVYVLAHFDDEYCALPLIWAARRERLDQHFLYLADYRDPALGARSFAETRALLAAQGLSSGSVRHLGGGSGAFDGEIHRHLDRLAQLLTEALSGLEVHRLVVPAWEGGHMDHDVCAALALRAAARLGDPPVWQFSLYNGPGLPGPLLHGSAPLPQNGPVTRLKLTTGEWLRWMAAVRFFPSQLYAWAGIWPAMFWTLARRGFGWQALSAARVAQRPHEGPLFYERMFKVPYAEVRQAIQASSDA